MSLPVKKVSLNVLAVILLLLFSVASFSVHARTIRSYGAKIDVARNDGRGYYFKADLNLQRPRSGLEYHTYYVLLREHPNGGEAMDDDDKDARRRWYESFLPSTLTDSGEPRLLHCHTFDTNGFLARLTRAEALVLANKPGVQSMFSDYRGPYRYSTTSCGFVTASTKRSSVLSRLAF